MDEIKAVIEGLLFISGEDGLTLDEITKIVELDKEEVKKIIKDLYNDYENINRGMHIEYLGEKFKLTTKAKHKEYYKKLVAEEESSNLSQS